MKQSWQQTKQVLARWAHMESVAYGLMQLLTLHDSDEVRQLAGFCPWRVGLPVTIGGLLDQFAADECERCIRHAGYGKSA